jgi:sugar lactone lactonase YvrE
MTRAGRRGALVSSAVSRREVVASLAALPLAANAQPAAAPPFATAPAAAATAAVPFAPGDVVAGCTLLNDPKDDHKGRGRILHYDANLKPKNTIWLDDTTHIVQGLRFGPDRTLWAFDTFAYRIARFATDGRRLADFTTAPARSFGHVSFAPDGRFFLGENYVGEKSRLPLRTTLPFMPGTKRLGDGHLFEFSPQGRLVREHATRTHGGMGGFQGLTSSAIAPDGRSVYYTSESGPTIFRYDLVGRRQLPDLLSFPENAGQFFFDVAFDGAGRLLAVRGQGVDAFDASTGAKLRSYPLQSFGWSSLSLPVGAKAHAFVTNFFTGEIAKLNLASGKVTARADAGIRKSLAGVAEFPG